MSTSPSATTPFRGEEAGSPATANARPQRGSITSLLILSLIFFMMTNNGGGDDLTVRNQYKDTLSSLEWQLGNYSGWLNGSDTTNFTIPTRPSGEYRIVSETVPRHGVLDPLTRSYYPNITGFTRGEASFRNLSSELVPAVEWNETEVAQMLGRWNWSATTRMTMSLLSRPVQVDQKEKEEFQDVAMLHGHVEVIDGNNARELQLDFAGIQFLGTGSVYGFAQEPGVSIDIRALPSLVPPDLLNVTARAVVPVIEDNIAKLKAILASNDLSSELNPSPPDSTCHFAIYAQVHPSNISAADMRELEDELMHPTGVTTVRRPPLQLDVAAISPECGILIEVREADGMRSRIFFRKVTSYAGFAGLVYLAMLLLLSHQMSESRTPAALARISRWSFIAQALADSIAFAGHITFAILADGRPSIALVAPAFLACGLFAYEVQFVLLIQQVQAPEDIGVLPPAPTPQATPPSALPENTTTTPSTELSFNGQNVDPTALVTTGTTPQQPPRQEASLLSIFRFILQLAWYDEHNRIWYFIFIVLALVVRVVVAPGLAVVLLAILYSSIWAPQIVRAARRGRPCALGGKYVIGTTVGRMLLATYFLGCPKNVMDVEPRPWVYVLSLFACAQAAVLGLQTTFGPAFFLPQRLADSQGYDYHPPLPDTETGPLGDCAICMDAIERPPEDVSGKSRRRGVRTHASYSLAPCAHLFVRFPLFVFHTECLERWLAIKNICPQCRRPLPPL
ncbi:hypothetical protein B0F90DRAFT_1623829 [Multifurca ochricompacta]|uniref:RING-type E3 ubiquitin transferase n=1 Tax=Multifurca ochricompacta TaxID=376703 RepID=A0AAD4MAR6_9AGAM|nr:hypothetical protein B0F90DRAFT_1623829 [Multifurca ochricompacta]